MGRSSPIWGGMEEENEVMVEMLRTWEERTNATWALERVPPTSPLFIDELGEFEVSKTTLRKDKNPHCPICLERLAVGDMATRLPCRHLYHYECLLPWLQLGQSLCLLACGCGFCGVTGSQPGGLGLSLLLAEGADEDDEDHNERNADDSADGRTCSQACIVLGGGAGRTGKRRHG